MTFSVRRCLLEAEGAAVRVIGIPSPHLGCHGFVHSFLDGHVVVAALVDDCGSDMLRAGFAGKDTTRALVPSATACLTVDTRAASVYGAACRAVRPCLFCFFSTATCTWQLLVRCWLPEEYIHAVFLGEYFRICRIQRFLVRQWIHVTSSLRLRGYSDPAIDSRHALRGVLSISLLTAR